MAVDMRNGDVMKWFRYLVTGVCTGVIVVLLEPCHHIICYMSGGHDQELLALALLCIFL